MLYGGKTSTISVAIYTEVVRNSYGTAAALASILTVSTVVMLLIFLKVSKGKVSIVSGANADVMAKTVATPLERAINGVPGMTYMTTVCTNDGMSPVSYTHLLSSFMVHPVEYDMSMIIWFEPSVTDLEALLVFCFRLTVQPCSRG